MGSWPVVSFLAVVLSPHTALAAALAMLLTVSMLPEVLRLEMVFFRGHDYVTARQVGGVRGVSPKGVSQWQIGKQVGDWMRHDRDGKRMVGYKYG